MQHPDVRVGIVQIPDSTTLRYPEDHVWEDLSKWILSDQPMLVTGDFGKGNDAGIARTAVAAGATVGKRVE